MCACLSVCMPASQALVRGHALRSREHVRVSLSKWRRFASHRVSSRELLRTYRLFSSSLTLQVFVCVCVCVCVCVDPAGVLRGAPLHLYTPCHSLFLPLSLCLSYMHTHTHYYCFCSLPHMPVYSHTHTHPPARAHAGGCRPPYFAHGPSPRACARARTHTHTHIHISDTGA